MTLIIPPELMRQLRAHAESSYPEEGAGLLLGAVNDDTRLVGSILELNNARESERRRSRYLITARDMLRAEDEAAQRGLDVLGVFHSHPDHPAQPSEVRPPVGHALVFLPHHQRQRRESRRESFMALDGRPGGIQRRTDRNPGTASSGIINL